MVLNQSLILSSSTCNQGITIFLNLINLKYYLVSQMYILSRTPATTYRLSFEKTAGNVNFLYPIATFLTPDGSFRGLLVPVTM